MRRVGWDLRVVEDQDIGVTGVDVITNAVGPMKVIPFDSHRSTNFAFSDKNPYPGWTACCVTDMQEGKLG